MAVIKCKMCGGDLVIEPGSTVAECEFCGSKQTIPNQDNDKKLTLFARANRLRMGSEFDKAAGIYESIVADFPEEAEAYWGLVLCKYGIEYVDDPATGKKIPTCHRSSFDSVMEDTDFEQALENADGAARKVYREEAKQIEELRKGIIEVSGKEEPYDIFICYKETDENGDRTIDSVIAQDVYDALTAKGYRVFFSRITLEDKLGQEYEPYIFAALNSAKIMLAFGTDYEYYNAVWVKNEWSRYLKLMAKDKTKHLIPCYKNIDAYDMPKEFAKLQAQDMGKVGAMQDLLRGIEKILPKAEKTEKVVQEKIIVQQAAPAAPANNVAPLLERAFMFLEDRKWRDAVNYFEKVLDQQPKNAQAYLGLLLADLWVCHQKELADYPEPFDTRESYGKVLRFADAELIDTLKEYNAHIRERNRERNDRAEKERLLKLSQAQARVSQYSNILSNGDFQINLNGTVNYHGYSHGYSANEVRTWRNIVSFCCEGSIDDKFVVGLRDDGTVVAAGYNKYGQCNVSDWKDITAVCVGNNHTVGLKADGTVIAVGYNEHGQCNVSEWKNIVAIGAGSDFTLGLKPDGTVVTTSSKAGDFSDWTDIVAISACRFRAVGLKSDGTVISNSYIELSDWTDIVAISAGRRHIVGLKADGTVVAAGDGKYGQCAVSGWTDIVAVSAGDDYTAGIKSDGTMVRCGYNLNSEKPRKVCDDLLHFREQLLENLKTRRAMLESASKKLAEVRPAFMKRKGLLCMGCREIIGVQPDGTVISTAPIGSPLEQQLRQWRDIVAVCGDSKIVVGLTSNGYVVNAIDSSRKDTSSLAKSISGVSTWNDIVAISIGSGSRDKVWIIGLKSDGTVVAAGDNEEGQCNVSGWKDIVAVYTQYSSTIGLKSDGTIVGTKDTEKLKYWKDVKDVVDFGGYDVALKSDGTVISTSTEQDVSDWTDIVAISEYPYATVGLKSDGTVVATGKNDKGQCNVSEWKDIAAVYTNWTGIFGLKSDGSVVSTNEKYGLSGWKLCMDPMKRFEDMIQSNLQEIDSLNKEMDSLSGAFAGMRRIILQSKMNRLEKENAEMQSRIDRFWNQKMKYERVVAERVKQK